MNNQLTKKMLAELESDVLLQLRDSNVASDVTKKVKAIFAKYSKTGSPKIALIKVKSSTVESVGYDSASQTLRVKFLSGATYDYLKVPTSIVNEITTTSSVGKFLNEKVKPNYGTLQIED